MGQQGRPKSAENMSVQELERLLEKKRLQQRPTEKQLEETFPGGGKLLIWHAYRDRIDALEQIILDIETDEKFHFRYASMLEKLKDLRGVYESQFLKRFPDGNMPEGPVLQPD